MPVILPTPSPKRELFRKLVDIGISALPYVGGPLVAIYSLTHPPKDESLKQEWREAITKLANDTEAAVDFLTARATLSEFAAFVGRWLSKNAEEGYEDIFDGDEIVAHLQGASEIEVIEALGELELEGMIKVSPTMASSVGRAIAYPKLYEVFDPIVLEGVSPRADAAVIAEAILATKDSVSMPDVADVNGWSIRRANPAISIIGQMIDEARKSSPYGIGYCVRVMTADAKERVLLRRLIEDVKGPQT